MSARVLAIRVLARVEATDAYLNVVLDTLLSESPPRDPRDAALATELVYGATRRQRALDYALARLSDRKLTTLEDRVLAALRVGAYQLFHTRIPPHAAVAGTVQALKEVGLARAAGYVNAILRRLAALPAPPLPPPSDTLAHLSVRESHPAWLVERWVRRHGAQRAEAMLMADNEAPAVVVRANATRTQRDALLAQLTEAGLAARPCASAPGGLVLPPLGRLEDVYGYAEGLWQVQDEAAQLVGHYAALPAGARVLDACAAPGGKACHLAESHEVRALDLHAHKLSRLTREAARLGLSRRLTVSAHDATQPFPAEWGAHDAVLLDAPCSGLGTLRRHPELRYRRREEDLTRLAGLQAALLDNCARAVPVGGLLVYAVCTTEPEEGSGQVAAFLARHPGFVLEPPPAPPPGMPLEAGCLRTLPGSEGWDGFYAARLRRTGAQGSSI